MEIAENHKVTRTEKKLRKIENLLNYEEVIEKFSIIDKTKKGLGGRPRKEVLMMTKILFVQYLYNMSDPELEDQLNDRLSFQHFVGLNMNSKVPDFTTIWRFRDSLIKYDLLDGLFELVIKECDNKGLIFKRGTIVDSTIIKSVNRPLSKEKGFAVPIDKWLHGALKPIVNEYLNATKLNEHRILNTKFVLSLVNDYYNKKGVNSHKIWFLLFFQMWYDEWGKGVSLE